MVTSCKPTLTRTHLAFRAVYVATLLILATIFQTTEPAQASTTSCKELYTVELTPGTGIGTEQHIIRYHFCDGRLAERDTVFTAPTDDVRFDGSWNVIYQDKYLISFGCDIVDLHTGELLYVGKCQKYLGAEDGLIYMQGTCYFPNDSSPPTQDPAVVFDLAKKEIRPVEEPNKWLLPGVVSPDGTMSAETSGFRDRCAIKISRLDGDSICLKANLSASFDHRVSDMIRIPLVWLDNEQIVTQKKNGELIVVGLDGTIKLLITVDVDDNIMHNPRMYRITTGQIDYENYIIDVEQKTATIRERIALGFGFERSWGNKIKDTQIYLNDSLIGTFDKIGLSRTAEGHLATELFPHGTRFMGDREIMVWTYGSQEWTNLEIPWLADLIGWAEVIE